jgi:hypothetical protein
MKISFGLFLAFVLFPLVSFGATAPVDPATAYCNTQMDA